jgi:hypothetical protein
VCWLIIQGMYFVNAKVPKGNEIHARMHEPFLSFLLIFHRKLVSVVLRVTLLAY